MRQFASSCRTALLIAMCTLVVRVVTAEPQQPVAAVPPVPGTGMIVGQVVDGTGAPVAESVVRLALYGVPEGPPGGRAIADREGRYFFADLPAGNYSLSTSKGGYTGGLYGQRGPDGDQAILTLKAGERRTDGILTLWKFAVISGTVLDEAGEPVVGIGVRALARQFIAGHLAFGSSYTLGNSPSAVTDDRGQFRLAQLLPGSYVVFVPSTLTTISLPTLATSQTPVFRGSLLGTGIYSNDLPGLGQARVLQVGDLTLQNPARVLTPRITSTGAVETYRAIYYPSAATAAEATPVVLASGEERSDITIRMQPVPTVRVSGRLVRPDGSAPPPMAIKLVGSAAAGVVDSDLNSGSGLPIPLYDTANAMSDASGRFTLLGVPPGDYVLKHARPIMYPAVAEGAGYSIAQPVSVGTSDVDDLTVELKPAFSVQGRVQLPEGVDASTVPAFVASGNANFESATGRPGWGFGSEQRQPNGPQTFGTAGAAGGLYVVEPIESAGWFVDSITIDGKDITDRAFDLTSNVTTLVVTYTNRPARVAGSVKNTRGAVSQDAAVMIFPADETRWTDYGKEPRIIRTASLNETGDFAFANIPPGDYFIIALEGEDLPTWRDPARLRALAAQATRITIAPHTPRTINLTSARAPR